MQSSTYHDVRNCAGSAGTAGQNLYVLDDATKADAQATNQLLSLMQSAMLSGKTVYLWVEGCRGPLPTFSGLQVNN